MAQNIRKIRQKEPLIMISNDLYDFLKAFFMVIMPSAISLYLMISAVFDFPGEVTLEIVGLSGMILMGLLLFTSSKKYFKSDVRCDGDIYVSLGEEGELLYSLELTDEPESLRFKSHICFKVVDTIEDPTS
jgi:hypothetical protein